MPSVKDRIAQLENRATEPGNEEEVAPTEAQQQTLTEPVNSGPEPIDDDDLIDRSTTVDSNDDDLIDRTTTVDSNEVSEETVSSLGTDLNPDEDGDDVTPHIIPVLQQEPQLLQQQQQQLEQKPPPPATPAPTPSWLSKAPATVKPQPMEVNIVQSPPAARPSWLEKAPTTQKQQEEQTFTEPKRNVPPPTVPSWLAKANEVRAQKAAAQVSSSATSKTAEVSSPLVKVHPVVIPDVPMPDVEDRPEFMEQSPKPTPKDEAETTPMEVESQKPTTKEEAKITPMEEESHKSATKEEAEISPMDEESQKPKEKAVSMPVSTPMEEEPMAEAFDETELARQVSSEDQDSTDGNKDIMMPLPPLTPNTTSLPPRPKTPPRPVPVTHVTRSASPLLDSGVSCASSLTGPDVFDTAAKPSDDDETMGMEEQGGRLWQEATKTVEKNTNTQLKIAALTRTLAELEKPKKAEIEYNVEEPQPATPVSETTTQGEEASDTPSMATKSTATGMNAFDIAIEKSKDYKPPQSQGDIGGRMWSAAAKKETSSPELEKIDYSTIGPVSAGGRPPLVNNPIRTESPAQSLGTNTTATTVGIGAFDRLRAETPDAFDGATKKDEGNPPVPDMKFQDEPEEDEPTEDKQAKNTSRTKPKKKTRSLIRDSQAKRAAPAPRPSAVVTLEETLMTEDGPFRSVKSPRTRRQLVQFLIVGIWVTIAGILGNIYLGFSCYFASAPMEVGAFNAEIDMRYGLWVYSPLQSAMTGFPYCNRYDEEHEGALLPQIFHLSASVTGMFSLLVMWYYLVSGTVSRGLWTIAIWSSFLAMILQLLVLLFFASDACQEATCSWGIGSSVVLVTAFAWFILAIELNHQYRSLRMIQPVTKNLHEVEMTQKPGSMDYSPPSM